MPIVCPLLELDLLPSLHGKEEHERASKCHFLYSTEERILGDIPLIIIKHNKQANIAHMLILTVERCMSSYKMNAAIP